MARTTRTLEERIADIDAKITKKKEELAVLEEQKYKLEHPLSMRDVLAKAKATGMSPHDIAEKLGIDIE